jgi:hypothetical protein
MRSQNLQIISQGVIKNDDQLQQKYQRCVHRHNENRASDGQGRA